MDHDSWSAVRDRIITIIRDALPIGGVPEEAADKILRIVQEQETGKVCRLMGIPRESVVRVWINDEGGISVQPLAYEQNITVDIGFALVAP